MSNATGHFVSASGAQQAAGSGDFRIDAKMSKRLHFAIGPRTDPPVTLHGVVFDILGRSSRDLVPRA
jgi:hypothetical protein